MSRCLTQDCSIPFSLTGCGRPTVGSERSSVLGSVGLSSVVVMRRCLVCRYQQDYGGSATLYLTAGVAGLVGTMFLGPRFGRFEPRTLPLFGHSIPVIVSPSRTRTSRHSFVSQVTSVGALLVAFGFFVLNSGADHRITGQAYGDRVGHGLVNTLLSGGASGATYYLLQRMIECRMDTFRGRCSPRCSLQLRNEPAVISSDVSSSRQSIRS
jgi:hypothetical protein